MIPFVSGQPVLNLERLIPPDSCIRDAYADFQAAAEVAQPLCLDGISYTVFDNRSWIDETQTKNPGTDLSLGKIVAHVKFTNLRIEDNLIAYSTNAPFDWAHADALNEVRNFLYHKLDALQVCVVVDGRSPIAGVVWEQSQFQPIRTCFSSLEHSYVVPDTLGLFAPDDVNTFAKWTEALVTRLKQQLRYVVSLAHAVFQSHKGLAEIPGVFVNERSWYLHHSAHPPERPVRAVPGCFPATLPGACFQPQPA